jgi:predicted ATPase
MLKRVSIQNFKSLKDVTLDLQKVNLLIGPNNSGKTNFLKALEYMVKDNTNQQEPDYERLAFNLNKGKKIELELIFDPNILFVCIVTENSEIQRSKGSIENSEKKYGSFLHYNPQGLKIELGPLLIYKPEPNKLTKPGPVGTGAETVDADASNLVGFLDLMLGKYRRPIFNRTEKDLHTCIPEFDEINLEDAPPTDELKKHFGDKSFKKIGLTNSKQGITYWADELSEGTLYFLALLCIINQPNPPKLLLLEEPEKGIHPRRIHEVVQFILRLSEEKDVQIIMTTHSPIVVDMFKDMPESVFIFDKDEEGATHVKNLQKDIIEIETKASKRLGIEPPHYTDSLGDAWTVGFLGGVPK